MATRVLYNELTAGATTEDIVVTEDQGAVTFWASGLAGGESVIFQQEVNGNYVPVVENGEAIVMDVDNTNQTCTGPAQFRLVISSSSGAVSVVMRDRNN
jgi:hypothetical protein